MSIHMIRNPRDHDLTQEMLEDDPRWYATRCQAKIPVPIEAFKYRVCTRVAKHVGPHRNEVAEWE